jgi:hypothetical protein
MARIQTEWPGWSASGHDGPQSEAEWRLTRRWREPFFSENEKIRETILPAKLAEKQPLETKHEKIREPRREPKEPAKTRPLCCHEPTIEPKHEPKGLFEFASISVIIG